MPRLLVVDDEEDILDFVQRVFRRAYTVERARSVEEALPILEQGVLDVLITDERMPRRSGSELLERARALQPGAVRVMLSGYSEREAHEDGADAYVRKPVDADTLREAVEGAIAARRTAGQGSG